jgi:ABC-type amino acid transport substrate-binding protein
MDTALAASERYLACMIDLPPWGDSQNPGVGIYADVFAGLARRTGMKIDYDVTPYSRTFRNVEVGDCAFTITAWSEGRSTLVTRGAVLALLDFGVIGRRGLDLSSYADLAHTILAVPRGFLIGDPFDHDGGIDKQFVYGFEQGITMVEGGHADAAFGSLPTLRRIIRLHGTAALFGPTLLIAKVPLALQMNVAFAQTEAARRLDAAVVELRESGAAANIIATQFGPDILETRSLD